MMLEPTMSDLLKTIPNRYLLVNIAAKRARDIADAAEMAEEPLEDKPVKLALYDIIDHRIRPVLHPVEETETESTSPEAMLAALEQTAPEKQETGLDMETENEEE